MNEPNENLIGVEQRHRLDTPIKLIDKYLKYLVPTTLILGLSYGFLFREVRALQLPVLISFFTTMDFAGLWALLVAIREISLGLRNKMTAGIVWIALFWGSWGIVVFVGTVVMIRSLLR